ncbi:SRPBCC family protein [Kribbella sp. NPDC051952]|uniref:SRPBCC family protein n=1 Tax=Kribbella sp. NPDC051952 TaxID=3154851 RepID=UPI00342E9940
MGSEGRCHAEASIELELDPQTAWNVVMDWDRQSRWMLLTQVWATGQDGTGVGGGVAARTSVGAIGFTDDMVITHWDPPRECTVKHLGKIVRGTGTFTITPLPTTPTNTPSTPSPTSNPNDTSNPAPTAKSSDAPNTSPTSASSSSSRCRFTWAEDVVPPLGKVGVVGWPVVRVGFEWMMRVSLRRLVREVAR